MGLLTDQLRPHLALLDPTLPDTLGYVLSGSVCLTKLAMAVYGIPWTSLNISPTP